MSDYWFPRSIVPLTNKTYAISRGANILESTVQGGSARQSLRYSLDVVPFTLNFSISDNAFAALLNFYDVTINHGANSFKMMLNSGSGIVEHQVYLKANTFKASRPFHNTWYVSFTATAESTLTQLETCDNLYQLWDCYGDESCNVLNAFEAFTTGSYFQ